MMSKFQTEKDKLFNFALSSPMLARQQFILTPVIMNTHTPKQNNEYDNQDRHITIVRGLIHTTKQSTPINEIKKVKK